MKDNFYKDSTSKILHIFIQDSSSTTGAGKTGLVYNSAGLTCYYKRNNASTPTHIPLRDIPSLGTFIASGFKEVNATYMPGVYEFHPPDAAFADGATSVVFMLTGASNMAPLPLEAAIKQSNDQDGVRFGLTGLPNANAQTIGGLPVLGTIGYGTVNASGGVVSADLVKVSGQLVTLYDLFGPSLYYANIKYIHENVDGVPEDEYGVQWYKNGYPLTSGDITTPTISVFNTQDGNELVASENMDYASTLLGVLDYRTQVSLQTSGVPFLVSVTATIDGSSRNWRQVVGLDII